MEAASPPALFAILIRSTAGITALSWTHSWTNTHTDAVCSGATTNLRRHTSSTSTYPKLPQPESTETLSVTIPADLQFARSEPACRYRADTVWPHTPTHPVLRATGTTAPTHSPAWVIRNLHSASVSAAEEEVRASVLCCCCFFWELTLQQTGNKAEPSSCRVTGQRLK